MSTNRWLATAVILLTSGAALAAPPKTITYSGFLLDSNGVPLGGSSTFTFRLYDALTGGNELYREVQSGILPSAADGYFSVTIGLGTLIPDLRFANQTYLSVQWGAEAEMSPRIPISSVPSAFSAVTVDWTGIQGRPTSSCSGATPYVTGIDANGAVTCAAAPSGAAGCSSGQLLKWNGNSWACAADDNTTYTAAAPITLTGTQFSIAAANATTSGYLTSGDWNTFNSKLGSVAVSAPLTGNGTAGTPLSMPAASGTQGGYLSSSDWTTFNGKLSSVSSSAPITGSGTLASPLGLATGGVTFSHWASNSCTPNQIPKYGASGWACAADADSGGDITGVTAGGGLSGGGTSGAVTVGLMTCTNGQILKMGSSAWGCAADSDTGTITGVTAGNGLTGGGTSGAVTLSASFGGSAGDFGTATTLARSDHAHGSLYNTKSELNAAGTINTATNPVDWTKLKNVPAGFADGVDDDTNTVLTVTTPLLLSPLGDLSIAQASDAVDGFLASGDFKTFMNKQGRDVAPTCPAGSYLMSVAADGTPTCGTPGDIYGVSVSAPLTGGGTTGSVSIGLQGCASGQILKANTSGAWVCSTDSTNTGTVTSVGTSAGLTGGPITGSGTIGIANDGVTGSMIKNGAITTGKMSLTYLTNGYTYRNSSSTPALAPGWQYIYPDASYAVTFTTNALCLVTAAAHWIIGTGFSGSYWYPAIKRGATDGNTAQNIWVPALTSGILTSSHTFPVLINANETTQFGCYVNVPNTTAITQISCFINYICY